MYVTRPLSMYKKFPSALELPPPEGPNSGILVIQDEETETTCCFGICKNIDELLELPFPQNKNLETRYSTSGSDNKTQVSYDKVVFIPVLNLPLSSNRYYAIQPTGTHKGEAFTSSNEEDKVTCCFCCTFISDVKPQPFDPNNDYQQFEICSKESGGFFAKSVAPDGYPPGFLNRTGYKGWTVVTETPKNFELDEAPGLDINLRAQEGTLKHQMSRSMYYEMTLEQRWEQIFACDNDYNEDNAAVVDVSFEREVVSFFGGGGETERSVEVDGVMWFKSLGDVGGGVSAVGLSSQVIERMKWEAERFGWVKGNERRVSVKRVEQCGGVGGQWSKFGCYVLVERFVLKRMDGNLVLNYDFNHTHHIKCKWE
ncbi:hypothetical protein EZV62_018063 [Acer yangbiense]|uniref:Insecticidal crystal toxin domain-containing protein n=1 Tax=Acer yangbiense TaxID=1000413 RepID=A0A5C7HI91_9ROSI|nr:hypothetical protein EZV62_018063 [Acer yangbiense]